MINFMKSNFLYIMLSISAVLTFIWLNHFKERLNAKTWVLILVSLLHVAVGVFSVKLFAYIEGFGKEYVGAMSLFGAVFFMPLFYFAGCKAFNRPAKDVFDIFTIPLVETLMLARFNCLVAGCCEGLQIPGTMIHYPTRETEILYYIAMIIVLAPRIQKQKTNGEIYPLYMMTYGIFRMINECFRVSTVTQSIFHISHIWAILSFIAGAGIYFEIQSRNNAKTLKRRKEIRR